MRRGAPSRAGRAADLLLPVVSVATSLALWEVCVTHRNHPSPSGPARQ